MTIVAEPEVVIDEKKELITGVNGRNTSTVLTAARLLMDGDAQVLVVTGVAAVVAQLV